MFNINAGEIAINQLHGRSNNIVVKVEFDISSYDQELLVNYFSKRLTGGEARRLEKEFELNSGMEKYDLYEYLDSLQNFVADEIRKDQYREVVVL